VGVGVTAGGGLVRVTAAETGGKVAGKVAEGAFVLQPARPNVSARNIVQIRLRFFTAAFLFFDCT